MLKTLPVTFAGIPSTPGANGTGGTELPLDLAQKSEDLKRK